MRTCLLLIFALLSACPAIAEESGAELFERGVAAYRTKAYDEAERCLTLALLDEELVASPEAQAAALFNLGNVVYRQGRTVRAVAHYTAASRLLPRDSGIETNLSIARAEAGLDPAVPADLGSTVLHAARSFTRSEVERIVIGALLLWLAALLFEAFRGGALARTLSWIGLGLALFSLFPYFATLSNTPRGRSMIVPPSSAKPSMRPSQDKAAVLAASFTPFHSEPRKDSSTLAQLPPATEVIRTDALPGWVEVSYEGRVGWVSDDRLAASDPKSAFELAHDSHLASSANELRTP